MEIAKARQLNHQDLDKEITKVRNQIVKLSSDIIMHKLKNPRALRAARKYLARLLTIRREKEIISS